jgi:lysyl-tRNA synthetase class 2
VSPVTRSAYLENARLRALRPALELRSRVLSAIRAFFLDRDFLEVETPVRLPTPALERHIDAEPSGAGFLRTSPELHMKRLLAAGHERLFQMGPCFRKGERGARHHPEYTMLEWYRANADYLEILRDTTDLLATLAPLAPQSSTINHSPLTIRVRDAFLQHAGWDPVAAYDADRFERDLVARVEPALPRDRPVVLMDYPAPAAALSRRKPGDAAVAERWELYLDGVEIANAFSELTDAAEQRARFKAWAEERRAAGCEVYPLDEAFLAALETGLPPSGGIALGVDRLVMVLAGATSLDAVIAFREEV